MTLLSDSSMNMFSSNIQSEFTVKLDHPIEIDEESWEVALAAITTPSEVFNITEEDNNFFFLTFPDQHSLYMKLGVENITEMCSNENSDCYKFKLKLPTGNYMSPEYLVEEMQASIDKFEKGILKHINAYISITYDALTIMKNLDPLRAYAGNVSAHNVRANEGKPLRMCWIVP